MRASFGPTVWMFPISINAVRNRTLPSTSHTRTEYFRVTRHRPKLMSAGASERASRCRHTVAAVARLRTQSQHVVITNTVTLSSNDRRLLSADCTLCAPRREGRASERTVRDMHFIRWRARYVTGARIKRVVVLCRSAARERCGRSIRVTSRTGI